MKKSRFCGVIRADRVRTWGEGALGIGLAQTSSRCLRRVFFPAAIVKTQNYQIMQNECKTSFCLKSANSNQIKTKQNLNKNKVIKCVNESQQQQPKQRLIQVEIHNGKMEPSFEHTKECVQLDIFTGYSELISAAKCQTEWNRC